MAGSSLPPEPPEETSARLWVSGGGMTPMPPPKPPHQSERHDMSSTTAIMLTRSDIITKLKAQVKLAEQLDRDAAAKHKRDEADYLAAFRAACREAVKWDYKTAATARFDPMKSPDKSRDYQGNPINRPSCPMSQAQWIKDELKRLELSNQETFKLGSDCTLHRALMWDPTPPKGVCD